MIKLSERAHAIKLLCLDVDGVLTDGSVYLGNNGEELKAFNIKDGFGLRAVQNVGVQVAIITGRQSLLVQRRADELGITHVYQGNSDKRAAFADLLKKLQLKPQQVAYVGDDFPDLPLMSKVGLAVAPNDAHNEVKAVAHWTTQNGGGRGAVREVCDLILQAQGHWQALRGEYAS
jgi:3-deoxy-D-manno-octulosonate 8-phosphate phosphatase (KDO 8-P phosphatase)